MSGDESVWWANTRSMFKAYLKGVEMEKHGGADANVVQWAKERGIVRVEIELKRRLLEECGLDRMDAITQQKLEAVFRERTEILRRVDRSDEPDVLQEIPAKYRMTAAAWLAGKDVRGLLSNGTLYRHAKVLRSFGIDILGSRAVECLHTKVRVIELEPVTAPDWYEWDKDKVA